MVIHMMDKVKVLVLGLGNFGHSWAASVLPACSDCAELVAVVDRDRDKWQGIDENVPKFTELEIALRETKPELVINVTPPALHYEINADLLKNQYAVLCEKPIADNCQNAEKMKVVVEETGGFLMIGENYRYHQIFRKAKEILKEQSLGKIHSVSCDFSHYHPDYSMFYHGSLQHPLLEDVSIHHFDLARYLSGAEPCRIWCKEYDAKYSWYDHRPASAFSVTEMTDHILFHYRGTLATPVSVTDWNGAWEIECDNGVMKIAGNKITLLTQQKAEEIDIPVLQEDARVFMLAEACSALRENRKGETDFSDNIKSFMWIHKAIASAATQSWITISD